MNRSTILTLLRERRDEIRARFGVKELSLFGSAARDELRADSDVDVLVEFDGPATFDRYFDLKSLLEELFARRVDLVTEKGLKPRARRHVERDLIRVA
jgi:predicted nucleotidyltransferase